jgi:serine/threonine protein kinase
MGVITYFLLAGYTPFDRDTQQQEMQAIIAGDYRFEPEEYWQNVSTTAKEFVTVCLTVDPAKRPTADESLQHKVCLLWWYSRLDLMILYLVVVG